ncbi:Isoquinoline 1-oxidoreductase subunit [Mameliella alba]|nr:Isoquinoline 1-oxidoreductase subunit [Antarctobacter heliothermus]MBY6145198.1 Isoquinoline 1-oxidoreductase subunit [Mameliella alba]MCA0954946.1 Isoquinoline 1-oxidoreductase subunit [Mameliella alba]
MSISTHLTRAVFVALLPFAAVAGDGNGDDLTPVSAFDEIADKGERSVALFGEMLKVIESPRCLNCHPVTGGPTQGDDMRPHEPPMVRGDGDFGAPGMYCTTCHTGDNVTFITGKGSIPGHEPWVLAPASMGWVGLTDNQICEQLKDPERNGGRSLDEIREHMAEDGLVGWAWHPGQGRTPAPGSQHEFGELVSAWIETGAACPG